MEMPLTRLQVAPQRKLPALYVMDSIVKNVGTPYTIYFGRGLYKTFMDAYASVDNNTRRKMEEMLKTWREPVPGSVDPRPVFPPEIARPIESALVQARNAAMQAHQKDWEREQRLLGRNHRPQAATPYRETPTPPDARTGAPLPAGQYPLRALPGMNGNSLIDLSSGLPASYPVHPVCSPARTSSATANTLSQPTIPATSTPQPLPTAPATLPLQQPILIPHADPAPPAGISIASLNEDVARLIEVSKASWIKNMGDHSIQGTLKALLDLQELLKNQNLQPDKLMLVKNQIDALSVNMAGHKAQNGIPSTAAPSYHPPPALVPQPVATALATATGAPPRPLVGPPTSAPPATISIDSLLGSGALSALLARAPAASQAPATTQLPPPAAAPRPQLPPQQGPQTVQTAGLAGTDPMALMSRLRLAGILPAVGHARSATAANPMLAPTPVSLTQGLSGVISSFKAGMPREPLQEIRFDIQLRASSLKQ